MSIVTPGQVLRSSHVAYVSVTCVHRPPVGQGCSEFAGAEVPTAASGMPGESLGAELHGAPCEGLRLDETGLYCYPDLTIVRGEPAFAATRPVTLLNPRVIIEVLSGTTEEYDRGAKVAHYRHRASVDLILLIDSQRRMVERQQRNPDGTWTLSEHTSGGVVVLEHEVPLAELYDGVFVAART